jgi:RNA-directed DNA polymerase
VFGDKHTGKHLLKFSWFKISRHELVRGTSSPDDPDLRDYWWERQKVNAKHQEFHVVRKGLRHNTLWLIG